MFEPLALPRLARAPLHLASTRGVAYGAPPVEALVAASASPEASDEPTTAPVCRHWAWADLMRRAFSKKPGPGIWSPRL
jgi:hypothetical protein